MSKTDFDNKLISFNRKITSNKTMYLEVQKKLNSLITKDYFTSNDVFQNTFLYQPTLDILELKITKVLIMFLVENHNSKLSHYILLSCIA